MVNQCVNTLCYKHHQPPEHESLCIACSLPLVSTPDYGPSLGAHQAYLGSSWTGFPYNYASPANSGSFYNSPAATGYSPSAQNLQAFSHPATGHNSPNFHTSPTIKNQNLSHLSPPARYNLSTTPRNLDRIPSHQPTAQPKLNSNPDHHHQPNSPAETSFVSYNPKAGKPAKDKSDRSCIACFRSNKKCKPQQGSKNCQNCVGKNRYCKEDIEPLRLVDTGSWFRDTATVLEGCSTYPGYSTDEPIWKVIVGISQSSPEDVKNTIPSPKRLSQGFQLDLRDLRGNTSTHNDHTKWANVLDSVFPKSKETTLNLVDTKTYNLDSLELLCRRFAACLVTIRNTRLCTMDSKVGKQPAAPYIMLEMLRQLSNESSYLYQEIFSALTAYLDGPRNKDHFSQQMFTLASCLGLVCCALKIFGGDSTDHADSHLEFINLFTVPPSVLSQLKYFGDTFNPIGFKNGLEGISFDLPGLHLMLPNQNPVYEVKDKYPGESITFFEIFEQCFRPTSTPPFENIGKVLNQDQNSQQPFSSPFGPPEQKESSGSSSPFRQTSPSVNDQLEDLSPDTVRRLEEESRMEITKLQNELTEENRRHQQDIDEEGRRHQRQVDNENGKHNVTRTQIKDKIRLIELSLGLSLTLTGEPSHVPAEDDDTDEPSPGETTLVGPDDNSILEARVIAESMENNHEMSPSLHAHFEFPGEITASPISEDESDCSIAEVNNMASKTIRKRKRFSNYFLSLKKQRVPELIARNDDTSAGDDVIMSEPVDHPVPDAPLPPTSTKQRLSRILTSLPSVMTRKAPTQKNMGRCVDITPMVPRFNPGTERPVSWPRSHRWRKSFGISVKQLRDNFEKLTVDPGEHLPSRPVG